MEHLRRCMFICEVPFRVFEEGKVYLSGTSSNNTLTMFCDGCIHVVNEFELANFKQVDAVSVLYCVLADITAAKSNKYLSDVSSEHVIKTLSENANKLLNTFKTVAI